MHSSLVDNLAQVIYAKNCPTTFYYIFHLVWVPMTTTQNIRVCFLCSKSTLFFIRVAPLNSFRFSFVQRGALIKKVFSRS